MDLSITKDSLPKAITAFGLDLYKKLNKSDVCKNIFLSPMSISTALGMVLVGAWGNTKTQMGKVLHFDRSLGSTRSYAFQRRMADVSEPERENVDGKINLEVKKLLSQLNHLNPGYQMNIANNLFIQNGYDFFQQYLVCIKDVYGATLESVDFFNATEEARQTINLEVEKQTQGNIKELFAPGVIGSDTVLVLANAIYFKATWEHQFDPSRTTEKDFRLNENESKPVQMMHQRGRFQLGLVRSINAQILCLPYVGELLSMIILLPKDIGDLEQVENSMTCETLADWTSQQNMMENHVEVYLPRFKLEDTFDLNITLQALGMTDVFDQSKADLSGMSPSQQLFLSKVIHKAYVDVNEVGTEAAAATGASVSSRSLISYELFLADHPFLFCIRHNPTNTILFLGKFCSP
nr:leukocyte elastase inhibitor-like [Anolis sagrei ordinatus]